MKAIATQRALAAKDLVQWVSGHAAQDLDLITHSHSGNVAMMATQPGLGMTSRRPEGLDERQGPADV